MLLMRLFIHVTLPTQPSSCPSVLTPPPCTIVQRDEAGAPIDVVTLVSHGSIVLRCRGPQLNFDLEWCLNVSSELGLLTMHGVGGQWSLAQVAGVAGWLAANMHHRLKHPPLEAPCCHFPATLPGFTGWLPLASPKREWANGPASQIVHPLSPLDEKAGDAAAGLPAAAAGQQQQQQQQRRQWRTQLVRLVTAATCIADVAAQRDMLLFGGAYT